MYIRLFLIALLATLSIATKAHAAGDSKVPLAGNYAVRAGDLNGDGRTDLYVEFQPDFVPITLDDLIIPIPTGQRVLAEFVLLQTASRTFDATAINTADRGRVAQWARTSLQAIVGDYNADSIPDVLIKNVASAIPGAFDTFVFGAPNGAKPIGVRAIDPTLTRFFRDISGWFNSPRQYFANAFIPQTTFVPVRVNVYDCGEPTYQQYFEGDPGETFALFNCYYLGFYFVNVPITVQVFDGNNFSGDAYNFTTYFSPSVIESPDEFRLSLPESMQLRQGISNLLGVPFGRDPNVPLGGYWELLKRIIERNAPIVLAALDDSIHTEAADPNPGRSARALDYLDSILRNLPRSASEGITRINYSKIELVKIVVALSRLAEAQNVDFFTDPDFGPERDMLTRCLIGHSDRFTTAWYFHEAAEAARLLSSGAAVLSNDAYLIAQKNAHESTIATQGTNSPDFYHPTVVRKYPVQFGNKAYDKVRNNFDE